MVATGTLRCLVTTPSSGEFRNTRRLIADALRDAGIEPILLEETGAPGTPTVALAQQAIERSDLIIADLTESNPNVMYEVGFAHASRKPVLLIAQRDVARVPADISGYLYFIYDPSTPEALRRYIRTWASRYLNDEKSEQANERA